MTKVRISRCLASATAALSFLALAPVPSAFGWGNLGHRVVAKLGATLAEDGDVFWRANERSLQAFANTPDVLWKSAAGGRENPTHWFHFDFYSPDGQALPTLFESYAKTVERYAEKQVVKNGTGVWRVEQFYVDARDAFRSGNEEEGLQWAGAMAHYVGDLSQPLHVTQNYDGQLTGQKGIHAYFESRNLESVASAEILERVEEEARVLLADPQWRASHDGGVVRAMLLQTKRSVDLVDEVLRVDERLGRRGDGAREQLDMAVSRLADGAATYAMVLSRLWREGERKDNGRIYTPAQPAWRAPEFSRAAFASSSSARPADVAEGLTACE
jgi:hypothetical protein